jgi:hypothetical protein
MYLLAEFVILVFFGFLHPEEELPARRLEFQDVDATGRALGNSLELDIILKAN